MRALLLGLLLLSCSADPSPPDAHCEWPAGRDMVDPRTGEKGVFLTEAEWDRLWVCVR